MLEEESLREENGRVMQEREALAAKVRELEAMAQEGAQQLSGEREQEHAELVSAGQLSKQSHQAPEAQLDAPLQGVVSEPEPERIAEEAAQVMKEQEEEHEEHDGQIISEQLRHVAEAEVDALPQGAALEANTSAECKLVSIPTAVEQVSSEDPAVQLQGVRDLRKHLSKERDPPIDMVISTGVVPRLVQLMQISPKPEVQFEATWALTNIASGTSDHTRQVVDGGAVPALVQALQSPNKNVCEQAIWGLGKIARDSPVHRDAVLSEETALSGVLSALQREGAAISALRNAAWTVSNLCQGKPPPQFGTVRAALPVSANLLASCVDEDMLTDICWALSYLSDGPNEKIQAVVDSGVCRRLVELLQHRSPSVVIPALRTVGNIVTGDDVQTQAILDCGALSSLRGLLGEPHKKSIKKEACWTLSNIVAGTKDQIQLAVDAGVFPGVLHLMQHAEFDVKKQAAWVISNCTLGGTRQQIKFLVDKGCIKPLCDLLGVQDSQVMVVVLEGLENILKAGEAEKQPGASHINLYAKLIEETKGRDKIEQLQNHPQDAVHCKAVKILESYFGFIQARRAAEEQARRAAEEHARRESQRLREVNARVLQERKQFSVKLEHMDAEERRLVEGSGVSVAFLQRFERRLRDRFPGRSLSTKEVVEELVIPDTRVSGEGGDEGVRYIDLPEMQRNGQVGRPMYFASHMWGGAFTKLVARVVETLEDADPELVYVWVDIFAISQHGGMGGAMGADLKRLQDCLRASEAGTLLVMDELEETQDDGTVLKLVPLKRAWCVYEIWSTLHLRGERRLRLHESGMARSAWHEVVDELDIRECHAWAQADKRMILASVEQTVGVEALNHRVKALFTLRPLFFEEDMQTLEEGEGALELAAVDAWLETNTWDAGKTLWIEGAAGGGKSTVSSAIVRRHRLREEAGESPPYAVLHLFVKHNDLR
eukprot:gene19290-23059_t